MLEDERILLVLIPTKGGGVSLRTGYSAGYTSQLHIIARAKCMSSTKRQASHSPAAGEGLQCVDNMWVTCRRLAGNV